MKPLKGFKLPTVNRHWTERSGVEQRSLRRAHSERSERFEIEFFKPAAVEVRKRNQGFVLLNHFPSLPHGSLCD